MNENVDPRAAAAKSNAPKQDLRAWLAQMEAAGEVTHISGAERDGSEQQNHNGVAHGTPPEK